ncbi:NACHT, LRR and PYD domains-containing protein 14 [Sciurus carolinensis]|uniref:NACHT, LRR and PYD domains-containing protein 14 n=1 Tax=Sciurus carolinensis TaxID=30640 RepID=UPI001FB1C01E|nr:NACHT, LRR and PYD domains-containing protein 14 [Sciurus carolinensis]
MADSSSSSFSFFSDFGLLLYLEELNKEELNKFKLLLKETMEPEPCLIPWTAVKKAKREELANLMNKYYPGERAWNVTLKIFAKMNLKDLCKRAKAEINWTAQTMGPENAEAGEAPVQEVVLGDGTEYKIQIKEKFSVILDRNSLLGEPADFHHGIIQEERNLLEHLFDVDVKTGDLPQTVVLQGAARVGKTTLMRKAMLDWAEGNLYQQRFAYVFYLNGREISQLKERSFAQLISEDWPSTEIPIERILSQPSNLLFIVDSFDELNFAFEEPQFALCKDWSQVHPVSFLMSSLLRKVMLSESFLLVTTRFTASKRLEYLLKSPHYAELLGMSEDARREYIYQFFEDETWAMKAFSSLRGNGMLFSMCQVPLLCWVICTCLKQQMVRGSDVMVICQTTTALFMCYISNLFKPVDGHSPSLPNEAQLRSLCHLAAKGIWTMTHVLYKDNLRKHGLTRSDLSIFLDLNILQKGTEYDNCYVFTNLQIQEFFAAMFYMLKGDWDSRDHSIQSFEDLKLLLESRSCQDPHLMQMKCFLFGLLNEDRVKKLEETFNCNISLELKSELLQWMEAFGKSDSSPSQVALLDLFFCLYETQDEAFVIQAMSYFPKVQINICKEFHLLVSSFCLQHCQCLQTMKLSVTEIFEKMLNSSPAADTWDNERIIHCWKNLCSVFHINDDLRELELCHSNLDELAMEIFYEELRHPNCKLQKLLLRFVTFPDGCQGISSFLTHNQNLMHLDLKGSDVGDNGVKSLCEALKQPECKLQNLRLESCDLTAVCCLNISKALIKSQSLVFLNLSTNNLLDDGVKLLCEALRHPKCCLEKLSLESCGLTEAGCEDLSLALISNKRLTHLCLADNVLGDNGVKLVSDALKHPQCTLRSLVLRCCHFTSLSSESLSTSLMHNKSLKHLDLGSNWLQDDGAKLLCDVFRQPTCNLQDLELMGCVLTSACCLDLASVILNNPNLHSLDLGNNDLQDDGIKILCDALRHPNSNIQTLGLEYCGLTSLCCQDLSSILHSNQRLIKVNLTQNALGREGIGKLCEVLKSQECKLQILGLCKEAFDEEAQKLLEAVGVSNPHLVIKPYCYDRNEEDGSRWWCS